MRVRLYGRRTRETTRCTSVIYNIGSDPFSDVVPDITYQIVGGGGGGNINIFPSYFLAQWSRKYQNNGQ